MLYKWSFWVLKPVTSKGWFKVISKGFPYAHTNSTGFLGPVPSNERHTIIIKEVFSWVTYLPDFSIRMEREQPRSLCCAKDGIHVSHMLHKPSATEPHPSPSPSISYPCQIDLAIQISPFPNECRVSSMPLPCAMRGLVCACRPLTHVLLLCTCTPHVCLPRA